MCIFCANKLIAVPDRLCKLFRRSEKDIISRLEDALAAEGMPAADAVEVGMECVHALIQLPPKAAVKIAQKRNIPNMDHEQHMLSFFLNFISTALSAMFGNACVGDHKPLVMIMLRIDSVEAACAAVLAATVHVYRCHTCHTYDGLSEALQLEGFKAFCESALIPASSGGGAPWRNAQFARWKKDELIMMYQGEDDMAVAVAGCRQCWHCQRPTLDAKCGGCRQACGGCECAIYCSSQCQKEDWDTHHKALCSALKQIHEEHRDDEDVDEGSRKSRHNALWACSIYVKWKARDAHWKPSIKGMPALINFVELLDARDN